MPTLTETWTATGNCLKPERSGRRRVGTSLPSSKFCLRASCFLPLFRKKCVLEEHSETSSQLIGQTLGSVHTKMGGWYTHRLFSKYIELEPETSGAAEILYIRQLVSWIVIVSSCTKMVTRTSRREEGLQPPAVL